jgi:hypothetical protein
MIREVRFVNLLVVFVVLVMRIIKGKIWYNLVMDYILVLEEKAM